MDTPLERLRQAADDGRLARLCDEHDLDLVHGSSLHALSERLDTAWLRRVDRDLMAGSS